METLKDDPAYKFYLSKTKLDVSGAWRDMTKDVVFQNTNKLKHHITQKHMGSNDSMAGGRGGRTSATAMLKAINDFYQPLHIRYEQQHAGDIEHRPSLPLKRDGKVNMTRMREMLHEMGKTGSCESCKAEKAVKFCCHETRRSGCDFFEYFTDIEEEDEDEEDEA
ncbi:hypothetical protein N7523_002255 [Penicillium sp. IBT 18751x]|nr:hypothetical protein N7523_010009 [Penicillium sp. IBT 18751x]KAJ6112253.1 hypothetical protein N7523_008314 [Penicillium sp. IBT 18751x]KAJ6116082.1 hypothetical protein N7523_006499 [Penicillium sp. IBT 18751x]KAJ6120584.1 hypothetical protein N7523_004864 [Penicillium sp. IBT 18751x]KAJ6126643.1 hypothetical protein N7523_002255 [Penicillium sp. IBT 18751x]